MIPLHDDNPTRIRPVITVALIVICTLIYLWQLSLGERNNRFVIFSLGLIPTVFFGGAELPPALAVVPAQATAFTSIFLHGSFMHLAGNMLYLWIFGNNVEDAMGHTRFVYFYVLCGILAAVAQALTQPSSAVPMIGASGAISGVLGAYLLLYPHARVLVALPIGLYLHITRLSATWVLAFWFVFQLVSSAFSGATGGGVAFFAHIGGFIAGMVLIPLFKRRDVPLLQPARPPTADRRRG
ncbi:MAG: rhomboid family intramembrane serine protease [Gammaproteobacteria bacterium]|nr:rhomboid family intramembrane serine protease [Gammaproteobacteria bacterium]